MNTSVLRVITNIINNKMHVVRMVNNVKYQCQNVEYYQIDT